MDKGKNNDAFKAEVNETAERFYNYKINENKSGCTNESKKLFSLLYFYAQRNYKIDEMYREMYIDVAIEVFDYCIKKWTPENRGFYQYYMHILNLRSNNIYNNKETPFDFNEKDYTDEANDCTVNVAEDVEDKLLFKYRFKLFTVVTATLKKSNKEKNVTLSACCFYSEFITSGIHEKKNIDLIRKNEHIIMKIVDHDFISYYMNGKNDSVDSISKGTLKRLSCFTGKPSDEKPCGYPLLQKYVYIGYISKINGKEYTEASIKYFKNELLKALHKAEDEQLIK